MREIADSASVEMDANGPNTVEFRLFRAMIAIVIITVTGALIVASWRIAAGLAIGGGLSVLNYHWLRTAMANVFQKEMMNGRPRIALPRFILRYFVLAAVVTVAYKLQAVSLPATIVGLCSFVPAFFFEASRQSYFAISGREESL